MRTQQRPRQPRSDAAQPRRCAATPPSPLLLLPLLRMALLLLPRPSLLLEQHTRQQRPSAILVALELGASSFYSTSSAAFAAAQKGCGKGEESHNAAV